jgi:hypothetical protein
MSLLVLRRMVGLSIISLFFFSCGKEKSVELGLPSTPGSGGSAVYGLSVNSGACMNANVLGTYKKGTATNATNKVNIEVSVNTIGSWSVNTAAITGFYFSGSGAFTATGTQTITLNAQGTPTSTGTQTFTLIVGPTTCTFDVVVDTTTGGPGPGPGPVSGEYFPMTQNSWWSYDDGTGGDTSKITVNGTGSFGGKTYTRFIQSYEGLPDTDTSFYRKDNTTGAYYLYQDLSDFSSMGVTFSQPTADVLYLKNALTTGATWNTDIAGTAGGFPVTVRFKFTCVNANLSPSINGKPFTNVYHVQLNVQLGLAGTFTDVDGPYDFFYAKGIGMIKTDDGFDEIDIRYWNVN